MSHEEELNKAMDEFIGATEYDEKTVTRYIIQHGFSFFSLMGFLLEVIRA